jgi:hypothetical protein
LIYLDTSVVVPLFVPGVESIVVRQWFARELSQAFAISDWTLTEFASAIGINVREKSLNVRQARQAYGLMSELAATSFALFCPTRDDFIRASEYLRQHELGLRAGDALHLAIACAHDAEAVYSFDRKFVSAGARLGINTAIPA